jgi:hypothetical protein
MEPQRGVRDKLTFIQQSLDSGACDVAVKESSALLEATIRQVCQRAMADLPYQDRRQLQTAEEQIGQGNKGLTEFTFGQIEGFRRKSDLFRKWAGHTGRDLGLLRSLDLSPIVELRNRLAHFSGSCSRCEAELVFAYLKNILAFVGYGQIEHAIPESFKVSREEESAASPITQLIKGSFSRGALGIGADEFDRPEGGRGDDLEIERITDFWRMEASTLAAEPTVVIEGTLSKYAPLLVGDQAMKRSLHFEFRRSLAKVLPDEKRCQVNALLGYTAGQMVLRLSMEELEWEYLGLYQSIVRNSIPVFVEKSYYRSVVGDLFGTEETSCIEAVVRGRVEQLPSSFVSEFLKQYQLSDLINLRVIQDASRPTYGLLVNGEDSEVRYVRRSRYLDGDIWVALELDEGEIFLSRFCDLSDPKDVRASEHFLDSEIQNAYGSRVKRVIFQYDQETRNLAVAQSVDLESLKRLFTS